MTAVVKSMLMTSESQGCDYKLSKFNYATWKAVTTYSLIYFIKQLTEQE